MRPARLQVQVQRLQVSHRHKGCATGYHPVNSSFSLSCTYFILLLVILILPPIHRPSTMSQPPRQDLIQNAILFLQDPKTQSSPLTSKIEFLQAKGLNESEIQDALSRSSSSPASTYNSRSIGESSGGGGYGMRYEMAPVPPKRDWRDLFVCPLLL